jgi:hypothetical protein
LDRQTLQFIRSSVHRTAVSRVARKAMPSVVPRSDNLASLIYLIRGEKVMLDADLAVLHGVPRAKSRR